MTSKEALGQGSGCHYHYHSEHVVEILVPKTRPMEVFIHHFSSPDIEKCAT